MLTRTLNAYLSSFAGLSRDVWMLGLVSFINRAGAMVFPFLAVYLTQELGFSKPNAALVLTSFGVGAVIGSIMGGRLSDRIGYYKVMFWSLFTTGLLFFFLQHIHSLVGLCLTVFVVGVVAESFRPANMASISAYSKPENYTRSLSLVRLAINLGFGMGPALGGILAHGLGYPWLFWVDGITCIGAALLFRHFLPEKKIAPKPIETIQVPIEKVLSPYRDKQFLIFYVLITLNAIAFLQFFSMVPVFLREEWHWKENMIGLLISGNGIIITLVEMPLVFRLEGRYHKISLVMLGAALIGVGFVLLNWTPHQFLAALLCLIAVTFGEIFQLPFANSIVVERSSPSNRGQYMGLYSSAWSFGHIIAPNIGMNVANSWGFSALWWVLSGCCLVGWMGFYLLGRNGFGKNEWIQK
jgi:predicted MFS family arabinose efflux permease